MLLVIVLFAVGQAAGQPEARTDDPEIELTYWDTMGPAEMATMKSLLADFADAHPKIRVRHESIPFTDAQAKFEFAAAARVAPDILRCEIAWTPLYADLGFLLPLEAGVDAEDLADFLPAPLAGNIFAGHLWGLPQVTDCLALIYNDRLVQDALEAAPGRAKHPSEWRTYDDLLATLAVIGEFQNGRGPGHHALFLRGDAYFVQPWIWLFGGGLISPDREVLIDRPGSVAGIEAFLRLKNELRLAPAEIDFANDYDNAMKAFKTGRAAMIVNGPWAVSDLLEGDAFSADRGGDPMALRVAPFPPQVAGGSPVGGHNYVVSRDCRHPVAALTLIRFLLEPQHQVRLAMRNHLLPTRRSAYDLMLQQAFITKPVIMGFKRQLDQAVNRPVIPEGGRIYPDFTRHFQRIFRGEVTAAEGCARIAADWRRLLGPTRAPTDRAPGAAPGRTPAERNPAGRVAPGLAGVAPLPSPTGPVDSAERP